MTSADVVDQLVPEVPESWFRWPSGWGDLSKISQIQTCSRGTLASVQAQIIYSIVLTLVGRLATRSPTFVHRWLLNPFLVFLGYLSLVQWLDNPFVIRTALIGSIISAVIIKYASCKWSGYGFTLAALGYIVALEYRLPANQFTASRGCLMILAMKLSALAFDFQKSLARRRTADLPSMVSYLISPATIPFGPFFTFDQHLRSLAPQKWKQEFQSLIKASFALLIAGFCLVYSSCIIELVFPKCQCLKEYGIAQSFRFSHYFVCFLSQALAQLSGVSTVAVNPHLIEIPWSMKDVVVAWNIPMHNYLKKYIFNEVHRFGGVLALAATFATSALFHGLNFQLSTVLFSLGFYCYAEHELREKLSNRFVLSRFRRGKRNWAALIINAIFLVINVYHLIYLGMVFDGSQSDTGYSSKHTLSVWQRHHFVSPAIAAVTYLLSVLPIF
ncbi:unnamed protein product, partial [Mesorhabditis belari]|uniref:Protein-serine O-palmitoleoyltransferase porcupine n=1 Tax=Mesorhabditis belari TaxID=2138241 RepID=A0AAF3FB44_9BILA